MQGVWQGTRSDEKTRNEARNRQGKKSRTAARYRQGVWQGTRTDEKVSNEARNRQGVWQGTRSDEKASNEARKKARAARRGGK